MSEKFDNTTEDIEKSANSVTLYIVILINISLMLYGIFLAGKLIANVTEDIGIFKAMWTSATSGTILHSFGIVVCFVIGFFHWFNKIIGKKFPILERVISILLKLPVNVLLLLTAFMFGWFGWAKYSVGVGDTLLGGNYILDWITVCTILYLVFGIKKI